MVNKKKTFERNELIGVAFNSEEKEIIRQAAQEKGLTMAGFIRIIVKDFLRKEGL